jgi:hypothetical protein
MRGGDFSVRMRGDYLGIDGKIADASMKSLRRTSAWRSNWRASAKSSAARGKPPARQFRPRQRRLG